MTSSKISQWEERLANDEFPRAEMILLLSDWRSDRSALIKKLEGIQEYHKKEIQSYVPRTRTFTVHETIINFCSTLILALTSENLNLLIEE